MKRLMGLLLFISFLLPFTAEGGMLAIQDCSCSGAGKIISFEVSVKNYSGVIGYFGFNVKYDPDILEYKNESNVHVDSLYVRDRGGYLEIQGRGNIEGRETGRIAYLNFKVKKCEETTSLELTNLSGDFWNWSRSNGSLQPSKEGGVGYRPYSPVYGYGGYGYGYPFSSFGAPASYGFGYPFSNYGTYTPYSLYTPYSSYSPYSPYTPYLLYMTLLI